MSYYIDESYTDNDSTQLVKLLKKCNTQCTITVNSNPTRYWSHSESGFSFTKNHSFDVVDPGDICFGVEPFDSLKAFENTNTRFIEFLLKDTTDVQVNIRINKSELLVIISIVSLNFNKCYTNYKLINMFTDSVLMDECISKLKEFRENQTSNTSNFINIYEG